MLDFKVCLQFLLEAHNADCHIKLYIYIYIYIYISSIYIQAVYIYICWLSDLTSRRDLAQASTGAQVVNFAACLMGASKT